MYTRTERIIGAATVLIAAAGQANYLFFGKSLLGFPAERVSILLYFPLGLFAYIILRKYPR